MEFIVGMVLGILIVVELIGAIMLVEEGKKTTNAVVSINKASRDIIRQQKLIMNEMGLDLRKQKQS